MTDKEYRTIKKRCKKILDKWCKTIGMGWYDLQIIWKRDFDDEVPNCDAKTNALWQYRKAYLTLYLSKLINDTDEVIEDTIVHELCHILTNPTWNLIDNPTTEQIKINEFTTEQIKNALIWVRKAGKNDKL